MRITLKTDTKKFNEVIKRLGTELYPQAAANTLNAIGGSINTQQRMNVKKDFIVRTQFTEKSLKFFKSKPMKNINRMNVIIGSISKYLHMHEEGGSINPNIPVPITSGSRDGNRRKIIPRKLRWDRVKDGGKYFTLKPTRSLSIGAGSKKGSLIHGRTRGGKTVAYRLKTPALFFRDSGGLRKIRDLSKRRYKLKGEYWHKGAVNKYAKYSLFETVFLREAQKLWGIIK